MSEIKEETLENPPLLSKRKGDLECLESDKKKKKPEISDISPPLIEENIEEDEIEDEDDEEDEEDDDDEDEEDEEDDEDEDKDKEAASNGNAAVDKGKGIMKEDKGKGKLKVEEGCEDGDGGADDDDDSDLSDDPLAEVDLNNILPSRTRRRVAQPGAYLVNDLDGEDDDSDDSE
eukprot:TRINITY_DN19535_c0_g1_i1.p1 TRINITY_DN19535_c0_g1~~TRINITY_DN19535_c0_g1_i1.p1  ORF type:complete len:175 (+),score=73.35 TRINITY_DN19535_c0_g1_i1:104-628(+)